MCRAVGRGVATARAAALAGRGRRRWERKYVGNAAARAEGRRADGGTREEGGGTRAWDAREISRARDARDGVQRERASRAGAVRGDGWSMSALARASRVAGGDGAKNEAKRD